MPGSTYERASRIRLALFFSGNLVAKSKIVEKYIDLREEQRAQFWPAVNEQKDLWHADSKRPGYRTVPRTLPLILRLIDKAAGEKVSGAYLDLWLLAYDEFVVPITNEDDRAYFSGYKHARTWRERVKSLQDLGLILTAPHASREYGFILVLNPHRVLPWLHARHPEKVDSKLYATLQARAIEAGVIDLKEGWDHPRDRRLPRISEGDETAPPSVIEA